MNQQIKQKYLLLIILLVHTVGVISISVEPEIAYLTPVTLILSYLVIMVSARFNVALLFVSLVVAGLGFLVEFIGISTGLLFGNYSYGALLGPKLLGVPLVIGLNWFIITFCSFQISGFIIKSPIMRSVLAGFLCMLFDIILEPVAIALNFWQWEGNVIPLYNYFCWFLLGTLFSLFYTKTRLDKKIPSLLYLTWILFFLLLTTTVCY